MECISAVTIGKLIEAHMEHEEQGKERKARIIRKKIDGTYKNDPKVVLDSVE